MTKILSTLAIGLLFALSIEQYSNAAQFTDTTPTFDVKSSTTENVAIQPQKPNPKSIKIRIKKVSLKGVPPYVGAIMIKCYAYTGDSKGPGQGGAEYGIGGPGGGGITIDQRDGGKQTKPFDVEGGPYDITLYPNDGKTPPTDPVKHAGCGLLFFVHNGPTIMPGYESSYQGSKILEGADIGGSWKLVKNFP